MAQSIIGNGESGLSVRNKLNDRWQVLAQSAVAASCGADTTEDVLATIPVPAGAMGANGVLLVTTSWTTTNGVSSKTIRVRFGGIAGAKYYEGLLTTVATTRDQREISNRNNAASQVGGTSQTGSSFGTSSGAIMTSSIDTSVDQTIVITGQKQVAGDVLTLEKYRVELYYAQ